MLERLPKNIRILSKGWDFAEFGHTGPTKFSSTHKHTLYNDSNEFKNQLLITITGGDIHIVGT